jgi:hypothetical protein
VEIPINVGVGPAFYFVTGDVQKDRSPLYGVQINVAAIIDKATLKKARKTIPKKYRKQVSKFDEVRISKIWVPDSLIVSPGNDDTASVYGVTLRPISLGIPIGALSISAGALVTYAYFDGEDIGGTTHFLRPGLDARAELEVAITESFLISAGWSSAVYIPQTLGGGVGDVSFSTASDTVWHIGQAFGVLHFRFPYETRL